MFANVRTGRRRCRSAETPPFEGRSLVEHYVARGSDETTQIDVNIYWGRVQNVLPGMEAAFVDIGIPKNAVLYRGDVRYDRDDVEGGGSAGDQPRIEEVLRPGQSILCQVTKNPIGAKGARLTQEVSIPGRFAVLVPNSSTFGISKPRRQRAPPAPAWTGSTTSDRLVGWPHRPHRGGSARAEELARMGLACWLRRAVEVEAARSTSPACSTRSPTWRSGSPESRNLEYRAVIDEMRPCSTRSGVTSPRSAPSCRAGRVLRPRREPLPLFERFHVHEQLHKALDRKVWLPSGGSLIIDDRGRRSST